MLSEWSIVYLTQACKVQVIDLANRDTCAYIKDHIPAEYLKYLYFDDQYGKHIRVTFNRRYNPKVKAYEGD